MLEQEAEKRAQEAIDGLHDVKTAVSLLTRNAEAIIAGLPGDTNDERIENAPSELKSLLKSVELLHTRLSMSSIVANPEAAAYGQKHPMPVYKVFHRMVRLFEALAAKRDVSIKMLGSSLSTPMCYDSLETIALVLIDNAIKYSLAGRWVDVRVDDVSGGGVRVSVESFGPVVPEEMRSAIFQRGQRAPYAAAFTSGGSGLGLYTASVVAAAHTFEILYQCRNLTSAGREGLNIFAFEIPGR